MLATVTYTATRPRLAGHLVGGTYVLPVTIGDLGEQASAVREVEYADGGARELTLDRVDRVYTLTFAPVRGAELLALREFLDSTESGEAFRVVPYGDHITLTLKRLDGGHSERPFMRAGGYLLDHYTAEVTAVQALQEATTVDIYNPVFGGGLGVPVVSYFPYEIEFVAQQTGGACGYSRTAGVPISGTLINENHSIAPTVNIGTSVFGPWFGLCIDTEGGEEPPATGFTDARIYDSGGILLKLLNISGASIDPQYFGGKTASSREWAWLAMSPDFDMTNGTTYRVLFL
jgi:hypothetical protein